jgi:CDGSH-type Zn-finger protein
MADSDTVITPYRDGPLLVRGTFKLLGQDGTEIELGGRETTTALCRCGKSRLRAFCDGTQPAMQAEQRHQIDRRERHRRYPVQIGHG